MPFLPGNAGRPKGSRDKRTLNFEEVLRKKNFNPAEALIQCYKDARQVYDNYGKIYEAICAARELKGLYPTDDKAEKYLKIAMDCARELASYCYPKLKATEPVKPNFLDGMSAQDKIEALRQMILLLEKESKDVSKSSLQPAP